MPQIIQPESPRYIVYTAGVPSGVAPYIRPRWVGVLDTSVGASSWYWVRKGVVKRWPHFNSSKRLDSRYSGPKSRYGQALRAAIDLCNKMNSEIVQLDISDVD